MYCVGGSDAETEGRRPPFAIGTPIGGVMSYVLSETFRTLEDVEAAVVDV